MYISSTTTGLVLALLAGLSTAAPAMESRDANTFKIHVVNNCPFVKQFALYQITPSFRMLEKSKPINVLPKKKAVIHAPYNELGMRLSGHAEWGTAGQWKPQALFEFGFSEYMGQGGSAYNVSLMEGTDKDIGMSAEPLANGKGSLQCPKKKCNPWDCPLDQGWTNPDQIKNGSPADTVCYKGKTDFKVVYCP